MKPKFNRRMQILLSDEIHNAMENNYKRYSHGKYSSMNHMIRCFIIKGIRGDGVEGKAEIERMEREGLM